MPIVMIEIYDKEEMRGAVKALKWLEKMAARNSSDFGRASEHLRDELEDICQEFLGCSIDKLPEEKSSRREEL